MSASWALQHLRKCEHCIKYSLWVLEGLRVNCLYNHLVTSAKTPECNSSSKPLGEETEICCSTTKLSLPPLRHTFFLPEYKSRVTTGLQRIKTFRSCTLLSNIKHVSHFRKHKSCPCYRDACFIEKGSAGGRVQSETCRWIRGGSWKNPSASFSQQPYSYSICNHASHLGGECVHVKRLELCVLPVILPSKTIFLINACTQPWRCFGWIRVRKETEASI